MAPRDKKSPSRTMLSKMGDGILNHNKLRHELKVRKTEKNGKYEGTYLKGVITYDKAFTKQWADKSFFDYFNDDI